MEPRPGVPRTVTDAQVEEVVVRTLEEVPEGGTHWSKRELAARVGISPSSVHRIWRAFGLQPWRTETFKVSPDPLLIDEVRDVAGRTRFAGEIASSSATRAASSSYDGCSGDAASPNQTMITNRTPAPTRRRSTRGVTGYVAGEREEYGGARCQPGIRS